jgi:DNA-binding transcriptional regulator YiaG
MAPLLPSHRLVAHNEERNYDDFIQQFTQQEVQKKTAKKPKPLTAAQHTALRQQLKEVRFLQPDYADGTKINISGILRKWEKYGA